MQAEGWSDRGPQIMRGRASEYPPCLSPRVEVPITGGLRFKVRGGKFKGDALGKFFMQ